MAIVIKKRVSFEFLGDEYKDSYINFQRIPVKDFEAIKNKIEETEKAGGLAFNLVLEVLKQYFIDGKFLGKDGLEEVKAEDLDGLDSEATLKCFGIMTGQDIDPKAPSPSPVPLETTDTTSK